LLFVGEEGHGNQRHTGRKSYELRRGFEHGEISYGIVVCDKHQQGKHENGSKLQTSPTEP
jgi:hypothetical protein